MQFDPPEEAVGFALSDDFEIAGEEVSAFAVHPVENADDLTYESVVAMRLTGAASLTRKVRVFETEALPPTTDSLQQLDRLVLSSDRDVTAVIGTVMMVLEDMDTKKITPALVAQSALDALIDMPEVSEVFLDEQQLADLLASA